MKTVITTYDVKSEAEDVVSSIHNVEDDVKHLHESFVTFTCDHYVLHQTEKEKLYNKLNRIEHDIHSMRVCIIWLIFGLFCSGVSIVSLCLHHLFS